MSKKEKKPWLQPRCIFNLVFVAAAAAAFSSSFFPPSQIGIILQELPPSQSQTLTIVPRYSQLAICDDPALCRCVWLAAFGSRVICVPRCCCCFCCIRLRWIVSFGTQQTNNIYKRRSIQIQLRRVYIYIKKWEGEKRLKIRVINQVPKAGNEGGERKKRKSYRKAEQ